MTRHNGHCANGACANGVGPNPCYSGSGYSTPYLAAEGAFGAASGGQFSNFVYQSKGGHDAIGLQSVAFPSASLGVAVGLQWGKMSYSSCNGDYCEHALETVQISQLNFSPASMPLASASTASSGAHSVGGPGYRSGSEERGSTVVLTFERMRTGWTPRLTIHSGGAPHSPWPRPRRSHPLPTQGEQEEGVRLRHRVHHLQQRRRPDLGVRDAAGAAGGHGAGRRRLHAGGGGGRAAEKCVSLPV